MRNNKVVVGFDIDGVLGNFSEVFLRYANLMYGYSRNTISTDWYYGDIMPRERFNLIWDEICKTPNVYLTEQPLPNCEDLDDLSELLEVEIVFITNRAQTAGLFVEIQTHLWLQTYFPRPACFVSRQSSVYITSDKGEMARSLQLDYYIDDLPENCYKVKQYVPQCRVFLQKRPHNSKCADLPKVNSVNEFVQLIREERNI